MTKLEEIVGYKKIELAQKKKDRPIASLERALKGRPPLIGFHEAIRREGVLSLIAEVKRASPSAGTIRADADAVAVAKEYEKAGAQALSVLTDSKFFAGSLEDLTSVKEAVSIPVLRKDFTLEEYQILESACAGADCVLLIVAILERPLLKRLIGFSRDLGLEALVEVTAAREIGEALETEATLIGINNRDLRTFEVDLKTTERLIHLIPPGRTVVSESGIRSREDTLRLQRAGVHAVLIGEELMSVENPGQRIKELMG